MARFLRTYGIYKLGEPALIGSGISFHGPGVRLTQPLDPSSGRFRDIESRLSPPAVVNIPVVFIAEPVRTQLAYSVRGKPKSQLSDPAVIGPGISFSGPLVRTADPLSANLLDRAIAQLGVHVMAAFESETEGERSASFPRAVSSPTENISCEVR